MNWSTASACARTSTHPPATSAGAQATALPGSRRVARARYAPAGRADLRRGPVARDEFWELLIDLSRRQGVTIFVSTHFMNEALRCDRVSLMHAGTVLACDTPARLMAERDTDDLETAFIGFIADAEAARQEQAGTPPPATRRSGRQGGRDRAAIPLASPRRPGAADEVRLEPGPHARLQPPRGPGDRTRPVRLLFAFLGSALMMLAFGFGITTDVENIRFAYLDLDQSPESVLMNRLPAAGFFAAFGAWPSTPISPEPSFLPSRSKLSSQSLAEPPQSALASGFVAESARFSFAAASRESIKRSCRSKS